MAAVYIPQCVQCGVVVSGIYIQRVGTTREVRGYCTITLCADVSVKSCIELNKMSRDSGYYLADSCLDTSVFDRISVSF
jgi:hypothetical protein